MQTIIHAEAGASPGGVEDKNNLRSTLRCHTCTKTLKKIERFVTKIFLSKKTDCKAIKSAKKEKKITLKFMSVS